jgi:glycosyltransferase involved in cell wall biosynthesis
MSSGRVLLCFAGDAWDGNPHSRHHLMRRFAQSWDVVFVEGVPMRSVARAGRSEWRRVVAKLRARPQLRTVAPGLHVLRPLPLPPAGRLGRRLQTEALRAQVVLARRRLGLRGPVVSWFSVPVAAPLRGRLGEAGSIFYYQDRYDSFSHVDREHLRACVASLARGCSLSVASAAQLRDDLVALGAEPVLVPHGVDTERFAGDPEPPPALAGLERPLVGYVGLIDDYLDLDQVLAVADGLRHGTVVLVGRANADVSRLRHPRVAMLGPRPYDEIPGYLSAFACCLIPFAINRLTEAVNPIKLREYLAAGRPVVSTPLPEVVPYGDVVALADEPSEFAHAVLERLQPEHDTAAERARRRARVAGDSWDAAAGAIAPLLDRLLPAGGVG